MTQNHSKEKKEYLGDGLYAQYDGYQVYLTAPREFGEHMVALEPSVLDSFMGYLERNLSLKITLEKVERTNGK